MLRTPGKIESIEDAVRIAIHYGRENAWLPSAGTISIEELRDETPSGTFDPHFAFRVWFRGVWFNDFDLKPSALRKPAYDEASAYWHFRLRCANDDRDTLGTIDQLCLMQHYYLPTCLLDWTENVLVALWFSLVGFSGSSIVYGQLLDAFGQQYVPTRTDGALYILNARNLNRVTRLDGSAGSEDWIDIPGSPNAITRGEMSKCATLDQLKQSTELGGPGSLECISREEVVKAIEALARPIHEK